MKTSDANTPVRSGITIKAWLMTVVVLCLLGLTVFASIAPGRGGDGRKAVGGPIPGTFGALEFSTLDGDTVSMSRYLGKPLLVEIWATWCGPCVKARQVLHAMSGEAERHANLIALSVDRGGAALVRTHLEKKNEASSPWLDLMADDPKFRSVIAPHDVKPTIPKLIYVDANGEVVDIEYGVPNSNWVLSRLKALASSRTSG